MSDLGDIDEVEELGPSDRETLEEVREVLEKRNATDRFGFFLLHSHFGLQPDETLIETVDRQGRTLTIRPGVPSENEGTLVPTAFRFMGNEIEAVQYCHRPKNSPVHAI